MIKVMDNLVSSADVLTDVKELRQQVSLIVKNTPVIDVHTHVYPPEFKSMCLYGIDDLLTYHYLIAEIFRSSRVSYAGFWKMTKAERADLIWKTLFVENTPMSEACRGIIWVLESFGLDTRAPNLREARSFFNSRNLPGHLDLVLKTARVSDVVMTNDPLHEAEAQVWMSGVKVDGRFHSSLRLDTLLNHWPDASRILARQGIPVNTELTRHTIDELRRFLDVWLERTHPLYLAVSLPADFKYPHDDARDRLIREVVLPTVRQHNLALTLMIGVRRGVNPALRAAGDGMGKADVMMLERLCAENPDVRILATFLSRENQHELCVAARKFNNLMPFGCWWFLNNPSIISEITRARFELLGPSFIPQHSDARVLEQLIYKWGHARQIIADVLADAYEQLLESGRAVTREEITRDLNRMLSGNFREWVGLPSVGAQIEAVQ
jgi:hypothetical protein